MLNFRKFAICGFLVAAVLVITSSKNVNPVAFRNFKAALEQVNYNNPNTIQYKDINLLDDVADDFKVQCLTQLDKMYGTRSVTEDVEPNRAHGALDAACRFYVKNMTNKITTHENEIIGQFTTIFERGNIIQFFVHMKKVIDKKKEMETAIKLLTKTYTTMKPDEARLWVILHEFDQGILGDYYTGARLSNLSPTPGAYVPFKNRFETFTASIKKVAKNRIYEVSTYKYQIDLLDKIDHDLKLRCLGIFEKRWPSQFTEENTPDLAYEALDEACKEYVRHIKRTLKLANEKYKIIWQFESMLKRGHILEFSVHKNKPNINEMKMKTEVERLTKAYKNEEMTQDEAKLWVIIYNYDEGILGDHYTGKGPKHAASTWVTPNRIDYVPIGDRFKNFIELVQEVVATEVKPKVTYKNDEIKQLANVDNDFKLQCLRQFDKRLDNELIRKFPKDLKEWEPRWESKDAYEALDEACKEYVGDILKTLKVAKELHIYAEIQSSFSSMLNKGKIIQFSVHKNDLNKDGNKMVTEIERLMTGYKEQQMTNDEAELWVVIYDDASKMMGKLSRQYYENTPVNPTKKSGRFRRLF